MTDFDAQRIRGSVEKNNRNMDQSTTDATREFEARIARLEGELDLIHMSLLWRILLRVRRMLHGPGQFLMLFGRRLAVIPKQPRVVNL